MEIIEQIGLSLLSNKTKEYIRKFCDFKGFELSVWLHPYAVELELFKNGEGATHCSFRDGRACEHNEYPDGFTFDASQFFDMKSCLKHLLYILNPSKIAFLFYIQSNEVSDESQFQMTVDCLKGVKILKFSAKCIPQMNHIVRLVNAFPQTNRLSLVKNSNQPFQLSTLRQILHRKIQKLNLVIDITLNELLLNNSATSDFYSERLRGKDINLFLKHWAAGLKPELEYISFQISAVNFVESTILAGIPH